ncbi:Alpha/beta hydrolase family protein [Giardia muris]|uniref:Alpha/beta hydrolase family protein n=1 Tax=Giardia muris TaxID=5742 RepID=A0A4Z1SN77_GIAMU|nr:Alpha/beta hydrolase family protein [Giardia muris]|eukprot:TNJ27204.1 Alpha/beta hydrolase family protein [Giardia muris]
MSLKTGKTMKKEKLGRHVEVEEGLCYDLDSACTVMLDLEFGRVRGYHHATGKSELVVFYHGFNFSLELYAPLLNKFGTQYDVISCDLPGHGETDSSEDVTAYQPELFIQCMSDVVDALNKEGRKFHLVGHSMGGLLAGLSATHPLFKDRILSLTMICPAGIKLIEKMDVKLLRSKLVQKIVANNKDIAEKSFEKSLEKRTLQHLPSELADHMRDEIKRCFSKNRDAFLDRTVYMSLNFPWSNCSEEFTKLADLNLPFDLWLSTRDAYINSKATAKFFSQSMFDGKVHIHIESDSLHDLPCLVPSKVLSSLKEHTSS